METINIEESDSDIECTSAEGCVLEYSDPATMNLLPSKSKEMYLREYSNFKDWYDKKEEKRITDKVVLEYFTEKSKVFKSSSLWAKYSMLKTTLAIKDSIDIRYPKLLAFLKEQSIGYKVKRSETFTREDIQIFLSNAPDETFLLMKVVLVIGIAGACRCIELTEMSIDDIEDKGSILIVRIPDCRTQVQRTFVVNGEISSGVNFIDIYRKYIALRPSKTSHRRLFVTYKAGKCSVQVVGKNTLGKIPSIIAEYLKKPNFDDYTGHCLRRTSAALLVDSGANVLSFKRRRESKFSTATEQFVENYVGSKRQAASNPIVKEEISLEEVKIEPIEIPESYEFFNFTSDADFVDYSTESKEQIIKEEISYEEKIANSSQSYKGKFIFKGLIAPTFTPFNNDLSLNLDVIQNYAYFLADSKIMGVLVNGTSGEGMSLNVTERKRITEEWAKTVKFTKQHLMVQVGGVPLPDVLELAKHAESVGVDSILCLPELYNKPTTSSDLIRYLQKVASVAPSTPLLYYHTPMYTNVNILMGQFLNDVAGKIPTFHGIKFTSTDLKDGIDAVTANGGKYTVFLGVDEIMAGAYTLGFDSAIATTLNMFSQLGIQILENVQQANLPKAREVQDILTKICGIVTKNGTWVPAMKAAMNLFTPIKCGKVREPLVNLTEEQIQEIVKEMKNIHF